MLRFFPVSILPQTPSYNTVATLLVLALNPSLVFAQDAVDEQQVEAKSFRAVRVDSAPTLDGKLDDLQWQQAELVTDFHQSNPGDHAQPSELTELYVVYTSDALYVAARMFDSEPDQIAAPTLRHGQGMPFDDRLVIILDPFNQGRAGYRFETNLNAARHDSLYTTPFRFTLDWNTIWEAATSVDGNSGIAEVEIPFKSLPFDPNLDTWALTSAAAYVAATKRWPGSLSIEPTTPPSWAR